MKYWIGGFEAYTRREGSPGSIRGDEFTGTLTSREFVVKKPYISFLVGGGNLPGQLGVKLKCGRDEVELATGCDSESMVRCNADVSKFVGQRAQLVVFDNATGQWGHINVDAFEGAAEPLPDAAQEFALSKNVESASYDDIDYSERLRPQFHFSSGRNWINDPNGMVYDGEKYHLFFQHNPQDTQWGNMTWGHAVSPDMVHWKQVKHALLPYRVDGHSGTIFSGTAVVDRNNSLGVQQGNVPTLCAFFTFANQPKFYQAMAFSTDRGTTWTYWNEGRPVVENQGFDSGERDPKVFWHAASKQWVMVLWVQQNPGRIRFFTSPNLTDWTFASDLMRDWAFECMDLAFIPVDGNREHTKARVVRRQLRLRGRGHSMASNSTPRPVPSMRAAETSTQRSPSTISRKNAQFKSVGCAADLIPRKPTVCHTTARCHSPATSRSTHSRAVPVCTFGQSKNCNRWWRRRMKNRMSVSAQATTC